MCVCVGGGEIAMKLEMLIESGKRSSFRKRLDTKQRGLNFLQKTQILILANGSLHRVLN